YRAQEAYVAYIHFFKYRGWNQPAAAFIQQYLCDNGIVYTITDITISSYTMIRLLNSFGPMHPYFPKRLERDRSQQAPMLHVFCAAEQGF
ncbi:MAG: hypothetical protein M3H12_07835, partial [Chromatiales bacterium]